MIATSKSALVRTTLAGALGLLAAFQPARAKSAELFVPLAFTEAEIQSHLATLPQLLNESARCLDDVYAQQVQHFRQWGISAFYGEASDYLLKMNVEQRKAFIKANLKPADGRPVTDELVNEIYSKMSRTSCVGFTFKCMGRGFEAAGQKKLWERLKRYTLDNYTDGSALQTALQGLGWKLLYWNPNPLMNADFDSQEENFVPKYKFATAYGQHEDRWKHLKKTGEYYRSRIDDMTTLVGYAHGAQPLLGQTNIGTTFVRGFQFQACQSNEPRRSIFAPRPKPSLANCLPQSFRNVPFFLGTAHAGFHVFMGSYGKVSESHAAMEITNPRLVEQGEFFGGGAGMSPKYNYYSGVIAVPPGFGF